MDEFAKAGVQHQLFEGVFSENETVRALSGTKRTSMSLLKVLIPILSKMSKAHVK